MCVRVRARVGHSVACGQWVAWRAHWSLNRMEQDQQVRAFLFVVGVAARVCGSFPGFPAVRKCI